MKKALNVIALVAVIAAISCKKDSTSTPATTTTSPTTPPAVTVNSTPQFTGTINDTNYSLVTGSVYSGGTSSGGGIGNPVNYGSYMANTNTNLPNINIFKGSLTFYTTYPDTATFDAFFNTGVYTYTMNFNTANGIQIEWVNSKGDIYSTNNGSGNQTGSTFMITAKHAQGYIYGTYYVEIMAKFNCTLYSSTTGASIKLTNGVYVGPFGSLE